MWLAINYFLYLFFMDSFKNKYGEVFTPKHLVDKMLDLIPNYIWKNTDTKWLDPGSGQGQFTENIYYRLYNHLEPFIPCKREREKHILHTMLHMIEINQLNVEKTIHNFSHFSQSPNIISANYLEYDLPHSSFDVIVGNPPFNFDSVKKVPTNTVKNKKNDGTTIWIDFVKKSLSLLKDNGILCFITPSIWLKPDKQKCYDLITQYQIHHIICMNNTETNKTFNGEAQTPTVIFTLQKCPKFKNTLIYDKDTNEFVNFNITNNIPIPVYGVSIVNKLLTYTNLYGSIKKYVHKTNPLTKNINIVTDNQNYPNISTCLLNQNKPNIVINYSNNPCPYHGITKLVLAHKMYGFPYYDKSGEYGISSRDNYVIIHDNISILENFFDFFNNHFAIYLFETTRYRMKYLEKYVFEFIPDISKIPNFPTTINQDTIMNFFNINETERNYIYNLHNYKYSFFEKN